MLIVSVSLEEQIQPSNRSTFPNFFQYEFKEL